MGIAKLLIKYLYNMFREIFVLKMPLEEFKHYDDYWEKRSQENGPPLFRYIYIAEQLPTTGTVVDIGCGDGRFLRLLHESKPLLRLIGIDKSECAINKLISQGIESKQFDFNSDLDLTLDGTVDFVIIMELLEHLFEPEKLMLDLKKLNANKYYITIPNMGYIVHRLRLAIGGKMPTTTIIFHIKEHIRFWTYADFEHWASFLGYKIVQCHGQNGFPLLWKLWPSIFASQMIYVLEIDDSL